MGIGPLLRQVSWAFASILALSTAARANGKSTLLACLKGQLGVLDRSFYGFHYVNSARLGIAPAELPSRLNDSRIAGHLQTASTAYFQSEGRKPGGEVHGLYVAIDPSVSAGYGGSDDGWLLYRIELPSGMSYLDLYDSPRIPEKLRKFLMSQGCDPAVFQLPEEKFTFANLILGKYSARCSELLAGLMKSLRVSSFRYKFGGASYPGGRPYSEDPAEFDQSAYVLIRSEPITPSRTALFWKGTADQSPEGLEKRYINYLSHKWGDAGKSPPAGFDAWARAHLVNWQPPEMSPGQTGSPWIISAPPPDEHDEAKSGVEH